MRKCLQFLFLTIIYAGSVTAQNTVVMNASSFSPAQMTITAGDQVTWTNNSGILHSSTSGTNCTMDNVWHSDVPNGQTFSRTFSTPGTYPYFCEYHCNVGMVGTITVNAAPTSTANAFETVSVKIYPNPAENTSSISMEMTQAGKTEVAIYDMMNNQVAVIASEEMLALGAHNFPFSTDNLPKGIYVVRISVNGRFVYAERLVKI